MKLLIVMSLFLVGLNLSAKTSDTNLVDGVGGIFIYSQDPGTLAKWYNEKLDIKFEDGGQGDHFYRVFRKDENDKSITVFSIFKTEEKISPKNQFIINLRLNDFDGTMKRLKETGVDIEKQEDYDYGRFAWLKDADGNPVEVWQPK